MELMLILAVALPILLGLICYFLPSKLRVAQQALVLLGAVDGLIAGVLIFINPSQVYSLSGTQLFRTDTLNGFIALAAGMFGLLITFYSLRYMDDVKKTARYFGSILCTIGAGFGVLLADHLIILLIFWGFLGFTLYLLVQSGGKDAAPAAKKTLVIIGGSDVLMLLGIVFIQRLTGSYSMGQASIPFSGTLSYLAFILLAVGGFAKAGAMPVHTWIPEVAATAPMPVTAYLPAALDKLLGIYFLARMCLTLFVMNGAMNLLLLIVGAVTIIAAVMMALVQHDMRRLLAYHAVSQVGYMVLGLGTGNPIGIAGGLFHMLNHSIYKACLFLSGGVVQKRAGSTDLKNLGGLGRLMPVTYLSFLVAALAISGIPPFNGFVSKWMVYQGLIEMGKNGGSLWIVWMLAAMFGSVLTLASFMKLTHSVFLGEPSPLILKKKIKDAGFFMGAPMVILAALCVLFGVFAFALPLKNFIIPVIPNITYSGVWEPGLATILIIIGLLIGLVVYLLGNVRKVREATPFVGGEKVLTEESRIRGTGFYDTIKNSVGLKPIYKLAERKNFDIYEQGNRLSYWMAKGLRLAHSGLLSAYILWLVIGLSALLIILVLT